MYQVVATSLEGAKYLVQLCQNSPDATRINQGVLIGSGQSHFLLRDESASIMGYLSDLESCVIADTAECYRSAYLPMQRIAVGGKLYRNGDVVLAKQQNTEIFFHINSFFLVNVNGTTQPVVLGDTYQLVWNPAGGVMHHPLSDTVYVKPFESGTILGLKDLQREIMLFPDVNGNFAVVDPFRETIPLPPVIVPVYPEENDMILVKGDDDEIWQAQVKRVLFAEKLVKGYFFVKHHNWNENKLWVRESRSSQMDSINFSSILDIATGEWQHSLWKES